MTVLTRMFDKNIVTREHRSKTYFYFPVKPKDTFIAECLDHHFSDLFKFYGEHVVKRFFVAAKKAKVSLIP